MRSDEPETCGLVTGFLQALHCMLVHRTQNSMSFACCGIASPGGQCGLPQGWDAAVPKH